MPGISGPKRIGGRDGKDNCLRENGVVEALKAKGLQRGQKHWVAWRLVSPHGRADFSVKPSIAAMLHQVLRDFRIIIRVCFGDRPGEDEAHTKN